MEKNHTAMQKLITSVSDISQGLNENELYDYVMRRANELLKEERQQIINAVDGFPITNRNLDGADYYEQTYT